MTKIVFIADVFAEEWLGGGELNNQELIKLLEERDCQVFAVKSDSVNLNFLQKMQDDVKVVVANFVRLSEDSKSYIENNCEYLIYEHDHKYLISRDPSIYENYIAPDEDIINLGFYKNAKAVICQSKLHADVVKKNIKTENIISVGGNLWSLEVLDLLSSLGDKKKKEAYSIWDSNNPIKNTALTKAYCVRKNLKYELIGEMPYEDFLNQMTDNKYFIFLPETLETLCRVVVECRMAGMTVLTNNKLGAVSEDWFELKGDDLINTMKKKREEIPNLVLELLK